MNNIWHCPALPVFETPAVYFHPFPSTCPSLLTCGSYKHARKAWYGLAKLKHASDHNNYQIYTLRKTENNSFTFSSEKLYSCVSCTSTNWAKMNKTFIWSFK